MRPPDDASTKMGYRIKTVSELTGIPKNTLVAWERRYGILNPERLPNGYRVYSDEDVALLVQIKSALAEGLRISEAVRLVNARQPPGPRSGEPSTDSEDAFEWVCDQLQHALLDYDRTRAEQITQRLIGVPHPTAITQVYFPVLRHVGDAWERGDITVAQEHFASAYIREQLIAMLLGLRCGPPHGIHVACTTFPDDPHEIGALGLAVMLATNGCRVTYLGANTPLESLKRFAKTQEPAWIFVSVILPTETDGIVVYAKELRQYSPESVSIAIGGAGLPDALPEIPGVELHRDWSALAVLPRPKE
jgi:DNA-binding transcriptional MerR regulator